MGALVCGQCGQRADERPGFVRSALPEAVFVGDECVKVDAFKCGSCGKLFVFAAGTVLVRKP